MPKKEIKIENETLEIIKNLGERIKTIRLIKNIPARSVAFETGIRKGTIYRIEQGDTSVSIGAYAAVLKALGNFDGEINKILDIKDKLEFREKYNIRIPKRATGTT